VAGFVSYGGGALGTRAVEQLRLVMAELKVATVRSQVQLSFLQILKTSQSLNLLPFKRKPSTQCWTKSLLGAAL